MGLQTNRPQSNRGSAGGFTPPTGTGLVAVTSGSLDSTAKVLSASDIRSTVGGTSGSGKAITDDGAGGLAWAAMSGGLAGPFGSGADGDVTLSDGAFVTLTRDMYYRNLTLSDYAVLITQNFKVFVSGILDISGLTGGAITDNINKYAFYGASGSSGDSFTGTNAVGSLGSGQGGVAGAFGQTGAGAAAENTTVLIGGNGGVGGGTGTSGTGSGGAGAAANTTAGLSASLDLQFFTTLPQRANAQISSVAVAPQLLGGGGGGRGGSGGAGNGTQQGGGGGAGGAGGGILWISAATINRSASTPASAIQCTGGDGSWGGPGQGTDCGGGSGGGGGGGGWILLFYGALTGTTATNCLDVSGGTGGAGGNGAGTGGGGQSGCGGGAGRITVINLSTGARTGGLGTTTQTDANAASGTNGGSFKAGNTYRVDL